MGGINDLGDSGSSYAERPSLKGYEEERNAFRESFLGIFHQAQREPTPQETLLATVEGMTPVQRNALAALLGTGPSGGRSAFLWLPDEAGRHQPPIRQSEDRRWGVGLLRRASGVAAILNKKGP